MQKDPVMIPQFLSILRIVKAKIQRFFFTGFSDCWCDISKYSWLRDHLGRWDGEWPVFHKYSAG